MVMFAPPEVILLYLFILFVISAIVSAPAAYFYKEESVPYLLIFWSFVFSVAWIGTVVEGVPYVNPLRMWSPVLFLAFSFPMAVGVSLAWKVEGPKAGIPTLGGKLRLIVSYLICGAIMILAVMPLAAGVFHRYYIPLDLPDDGIVRDKAFGYESVATFGYYMLVSLFISVLIVVLTVLRGWTGLLAGLGVLTVFALLLAVILAVNVFGVGAMWSAEFSGWTLQDVLGTVGIEVPEWMEGAFNPEIKPIPGTEEIVEAATEATEGSGTDWWTDFWRGVLSPAVVRMVF